MKVHLCKYCMNNSLSYITQYARYTYYVYVLLILHVISTLKLQKTTNIPPKAENRSEWNGSNLSISRVFLMECFLLLQLTKFLFYFWSYLNYWYKMCQKCSLLLFFYLWCILHWCRRMTYSCIEGTIYVKIWHYFALFVF